MRKKILNEFLKLKHSKLLYFMTGAIIFSPLALLMMVIILNSDPKYEQVTYVEYMALILKFILSFVSILIFTWITAETVAREFKMDTLKSQLTIPISRSDFLIAKLVMISFIVVMLTMMNCLLGILISILYGFPGITWSATLNFLFIYFKTSILVLPFSYFTILMVMYTRRTMLPMVVNVVVVLMTSVISGTEFRDIFPWMIPMRIIFVTPETSQGFTMAQSYIALTLLGLVSIFLAERRINRMEI